MTHFSVAELREDQIELTFPLARVAALANDAEPWCARLRALRDKGGVTGLFVGGALFGFFAWRVEEGLLKVDPFVTLEVNGAAPGRSRLSEAADALARARGCVAVEIRLPTRLYADAHSSRTAGWQRLGHSLDAVIFRKEVAVPERA